MGRKYAVVARITPLEILSKSKPDNVLPKIKTQIAIYFKKFWKIILSFDNWKFLRFKLHYQQK